jgi:TrmH family RNA methyltransferase
MPRITSRDNPRFKEAVRLIASSRERRKAGRCVLEGEHLVRAYCERIGPPESLLVAEAALERPALQALLASVPSTRTIVVAATAWNELGQLPAAAGVLAVVPAPQPQFRSAADFCLLLEDVQDPGNVGSILRSAAAAGVAQVFLSQECAFAWSPKVLRAGMGGHFGVGIGQVDDLAAAVSGMRLICTVVHGGRPLREADLSGPIGWAFGAEGAGLSARLVARAAEQVTIPMASGESLNVAAAAAICLYESFSRPGAGS